MRCTRWSSCRCGLGEWIGGGLKPTLLVEDGHTQPLTDEGGGFFTLDFDCQFVFLQQLGGGFLQDGVEFKAASDAVG